MSENKIETTSLAEQQNTNSEEKSIQTQFEEKLGINSEKTQPKTLISNEFKNNLKNLQTVLNSGLINPQQGQNLLNNIIQEALKLNVQNKQEDLARETGVKEDPFTEFAKENPKFFDIEGRNEILKYLQSDNITVDKDELSKISKIVEAVENSAIERYLKKVAHEENLEKLNLQAKQKLKANAQNTKSESKNLSTFTREQIGKMTSAEFLKNEALIMDQLKKGLIK